MEISLALYNILPRLHIPAAGVAARQHNKGQLFPIEAVSIGKLLE
jgi:hypothetical protein